jgi:CheY-like chemotaxis protein
MAKLVVISKGVSASSPELSEKWITIGRADGNTFQIAEASVSGRHCEAQLRGGELVVRDLQSTNGTFVDGKKISEAVVKSGQTFRLGEVELRFETSAEQPATSFTSKMLASATADLAAPKPVAVSLFVPVAEAKKIIPAENGIEPAKKFSVLFVDDSMAFLETFSDLCEALSNSTWGIQYATSADRALAVLQEKTVDLVVLDVGMPMVDGLQLLGIINRRYPGLKIAVMTGNATEAKRADALANGAELFIEKPVTSEGIKSVFNMLNDLVSWAHREGFTGALRQVGMQELIQMECIGRHSSILEIRNAEVRGQIYIEAGAVMHAAVGQLTGEPAFHRLLSFKGGEFQVKPFKSPPQRTINDRWEFLLMDAARASDEETGMLKKTAAPAEPEKTPSPKTSGEHGALGEDIVVVATYDGQWNQADAKK